MGSIRGRKTFLRWLPEMNGDWMNYGPPTAPSYYVRVWQKMYGIMKQYSPDTIIVWSPNFDLKPGNTAYWPGAQYVDWVGTSVYWKGFGYNNAMPSSYIGDSMATVYNEYAVKYGKPFVISECSGAWESGPGRDPSTGQQFTNVTSTVDQVEFQRSFWAPLLNTAFLDAHPLLRAAYIFEEEKQEEFYTDFRVTNDTAVRTMFTGLVDALDRTGRLQWASSSNSVAPAVPTTISGNASVVTVATTSSKSSARQAVCSVIFLLLTTLML
ncbi:glycoside hydrolase superfamily [Obelidium mucronatum]|nr:glycoside hydrolase superfamily [Obelidium mucronatum]